MSSSSRDGTTDVNEAFPYQELGREGGSGNYVSRLPILWYPAVIETGLATLIKRTDWVKAQVPWGCGNMPAGLVVPWTKI